MVKSLQWWVFSGLREKLARFTGCHRRDVSDLLYGASFQ